MADTFLVDGSLDWSGGVNSLAVTTVASPRIPNGLMRNELAWLVNGTVRDGGISPRNGYTFLGTLYDPSGLFQGAATYQPDNANPLLMVLRTASRRRQTARTFPLPNVRVSA